MGKKLIIKGADFSANRLKVEEWYYYTKGSATNQVALSSYSPLSLSSANTLLLIGKQINTIRLYSVYSGSLVIGKLSGGIVTDIETFTVISGYNIITLTAPIILNAGEKITFSGISIRGSRVEGLSADHTPEISSGYSYTTNQAEPCGVTGGNVYLTLDIGYIN